MARQAVEDDLKRDYSIPVAANRIDTAAETIMQRRDTHWEDRTLPDGKTVHIVGC